LRKDGEALVRDPLPAAAERDYLAHRDATMQVLDFYTYAQDDQSRAAPDNWMQVTREVKDGRGHILLRSRENEASVEVTYRVVNGTELDWEAKAVAREQAYQLALDEDDRQIAEGVEIYNERHPRP
jgi:hypothetical protein